MKSALYVGTVMHQRYIPRQHRFRYPFFMWLLNLDELEHQPDIGRWFSVRRFALSRFHRPDYLGAVEEPLHHSVKRRMAELTGKPVSGHVCGLLNLRTLGLYFSPVNFYFGFDATGNCSHLLAEVSNTPWNERHHYAYEMDPDRSPLVQDKEFHVSPFNPLDQQYRWHVEPPGQKVAIRIEVHDRRGHIFNAVLNLQRHPLTAPEVRRQLLRKPVMTISTIFGIYSQALRLYLKKIPYVPYRKEQT